MSLYKQFATNSEKEMEGVEVQMTEAENEDGSIPTFVVSRMGKSNKRYSKALEAATRPYRRQIELGTMNNDKAEEIFMGVFVDTVLKGWEFQLTAARRRLAKYPASIVSHLRFQLTAARRRLVPPLKPLTGKACIALFR